jgi:purine-binding chemotaxis protein CheW
VTQREATRLEAVRQETARRDAARDRDLKAARTLALARRVDGGAERARATFPYLVCACGEDRFGLALERVARVLPGRAATPVPGADPMVEGLVALSGRIVGVVGLARALGRTAPDPAEGGHLVLLRGEPPVALAVDRAIGIVRTGRGGAEPGSPAESPLGNGTASDYVPAADGHPDFVIVDPSPLLRRLMP